MKQRIFLIIILLCLPVSGWGAAITSAQSGNWSNTATWTGGVVPDPVLDTAAIAAAHTVTLDDSRTIPAVTIGTTTGTLAALVISGQVTLNGDILVGDNTNGYVGRLQLNGGSVLSLNSTAGIKLNKGEFITGATSGGSRAVVTGSGGTITSGTKGAAGCGMKINLNYADFTNTGAIEFKPYQRIDGIITSEITSTHSTFIGTGSVMYGFNGMTQLTVPYTIEYNDYRNVAYTASLGGYNVLLVGQGAARTGAINVRYNTFKMNNGGAAGVITNNGLYSANFERNVFYDTKIQNASSVNGTTQYNTFYLSTSIPSGSNVFTPSKGENYHRNIILADNLNAHPHDFTGSSMAGYTATISDNIIDLADSSSNPFMPSAFNETYTNNIITGHFQDGWEMHQSAAATGNLTLLNNTLISVEKYGDYGRIIAAETAHYANAGTTTVKNNLVYNNVSGTTYMFSGNNNTGSTTNEIDVLDYNNYYAQSGAIAVLNPGVGDAGSGVGSAVLYPPTGHVYPDEGFGANDKTDNPQLKNANYNGVIGFTGTNRVNFALDQLKINGIDISGNPATPIWTCDALRSAILDAYTPTNPALKGAGEGGVDIGAVPVQVATTNRKPSEYRFNYNLSY